MLYDPKWEVRHSTPPLEGLVAWLETKDPSQTYEWLSCNPCLIEQYCLSIGISHDDVFRFRKDGTNIYLDLTMPHRIALKGEHTFGAALERARAALTN